MPTAKKKPDILKVEGKSEAPIPSVLAGQIATGTDLSAYDKFAQPEVVEGDSLEALRALAQELLNGERKVVEATAALLKAKQALAEVQEHRLPDLMEKHSLKKFNFVDKTTGLTRIIEFVEKWAIAMPPKSGKTADPQWRMKHDAIFEWLGEVGKAGSIKKELIASLGLMDDKTATELLTKFKTEHADLDVAFNKFIEPATLTALVSKMKDDGKTVIEYIKATPVREARIKGSEK